MATNRNESIIQQVVTPVAMLLSCLLPVFTVGAECSLVVAAALKVVLC
jgi:hypothetical protein